MLHHPVLLAMTLVACTSPPPAPTSTPPVAVAAAEPDPVPAGPHLVILGVAQDAGHPQAGCTKRCCSRVRSGEAPGHRVVSLGLIDGDHRVLFEATPDLPSQLGELSPEGRLDGIFLTHAHMGHYAGLLHLGREAMGADAVPVWVMPRMQAFLERDRPWSLLVDQAHIQLRPLADGAAVQASPKVQVTPFVVPHRDEISETVGYKIVGPERTVAFIPDIDKWDRWQTPIEELVQEVDVAMIDATFYANGEIPRDMSLIPHPFVHESVERMGKLPQSERSKVIFIHFNHTNPLLDPRGPEAQGVIGRSFRVAEEGLRIGL